MSSNDNRNDNPISAISRINDVIPETDHKISYRIDDRGPLNAKEFQCTYYLGADVIASGEWERSKAEARRSAANTSLPLLRQWGHNAP